jgi:precorrin-8X/cobalt-precorrin-8 methylmutase
MSIELEKMGPEEIERRSFELIEQELPHPLDPALAPVILRVIHTTADFEYVDSLFFSPGALQAGLDALRSGTTIVTDTNMARTGINKTALSMLHGEAQCYMADADVAESARAEGGTRAAAAMEKAALLGGSPIFAIGNAPTALIRLYELIREGRVRPALIIGVPVGFVNVVQSKELIMTAGVPCIVTRGRKGGSNVAAAIVNALMYRITRRNDA